LNMDQSIINGKFYAVLLAHCNNVLERNRIVLLLLYKKNTTPTNELKEE